MRRHVGVAAGFAAMAILAGCGLEPGKACPALAALVGVGLEVAPPLADTVDHATLTACWDGGCQTHAVGLEQATAADSQGCAGADPDDTCYASAVRIGDLAGFADIRDLPKRPVLMTVVLHGRAGKPVFDQRLTVTPKAVYPGGPECGEGGPQARLVVAAGRLSERA